MKIMYAMHKVQD